jgi:hypothetical protein
MLPAESQSSEGRVVLCVLFRALASSAVKDFDCKDREEIAKSAKKLP